MSCVLFSIDLMFTWMEFLLDILSVASAQNANPWLKLKEYNDRKCARERVSLSVSNDDYRSDDRSPLSVAPSPPPTLSFSVFRKTVEISYMAREQSGARAAGARKSEISVAACHGGFRVRRLESRVESRVDSTRLDSTWRAGQVVNSPGSLRGSVGPDRLSRTRPATPPREATTTETEHTLLLSARQTGRRRERPAVAAVRHAIRQKIVARARGQDGCMRVGVKERRRERTGEKYDRRNGEVVVEESPR